MAVGCKMDQLDCTVYVLLGDGEVEEGQIWEAAMFASHFKLDNIIAFVDYNKLQVDGETKRIMNLEPLSAKWKAFGWHVREINGHSMSEILDSIDTAKSVKRMPSVVIAHTVKGKGVSFMENKPEWHGKAPNHEQYLQALSEL
jgi:transketolase